MYKMENTLNSNELQYDYLNFLKGNGFVMAVNVTVQD